MIKLTIFGRILRFDFFSSFDVEQRVKLLAIRIYTGFPMGKQIRLVGGRKKNCLSTEKIAKSILYDWPIQIFCCMSFECTLYVQTLISKHLSIYFLFDNFIPQKKPKVASAEHWSIDSTIDSNALDTTLPKSSSSKQFLSKVRIYFFG